MKRILITTFVLLPIAVSAQWGITPNQAMVKQSIEPSLVVVCSAYKLQDSSGQHYGRNNRTEFSQGYTLGIVTDSGLITASSSIKPWLYDTDYTRYSQSHKPVLSEMSFRPIGDSSYSSLPISIDSSSSLIMSVRSDSLVNIPALSIHSDTSYRNGWLLWCFASDTLGKAGAVSTSAIVCSSELNGSITAQPVVVPAMPSMVRDSVAAPKPVGAVWVVPTYPKAGMIQLRVAGIAIKDSAGWLLVPIHRNIANNQVGSSPDEEPVNELTPSPHSQHNQGKKNKRNKKN